MTDASQHNDAHYAEVLAFPNRRELARRVLGGHVGVGTVLLAFAIGPAIDAGLRRFHLPVHDDAREVLGE